MLVAIDLTPALKLREREDDIEEDEDGHGIWPAPKRPFLLPSPWQSLPLDLLFHSVLVRLPFSVLLKLRSVSYLWHLRLSSYDFWLLWFQGNSNPNPIHDVSLNPNLIQKPSPDCNGMGMVVPNHWNRNSHHFSSPNHPYHVLDSIISNCGANPSNCSVPCLLLCSARSKASRGCQAAYWLRQSSIRFVHQQDGAATYRIPRYWSLLHDSFIQVQEPYILLASDGGLLLLSTYGSEGSQKLIVCNPLLRAHKVICNSFIPPLADISIMAADFIVDLIVDKQHGEYRVLLSHGSCQVYNSSTGKWKIVLTELFKDSVNASLPILDGFYFWLSHQRMSTNKNGESTLFAYHSDADVVTCVSTRFPQGVSFPNGGRVWKDSYGLQTLAWSFTWFGTWKLENGLWKCEKALPFSPPNSKFSTMLDYVKVDNLLLLRFLKSNQVYVFDFGLDKACWTPYCVESEYLTGHCVFQPSCIQV